MNFKQIALERAFQRDDALDQQRVRVLEVQVHDAHHADAHQLRLEHGAQLLLVVGVDRGGDQLGLFGGAHGRGLDVFEGGEI